jgi:DNA-directed RNA polymerase sigma subunit (sigma70/sigma32)
MMRKQTKASINYRQINARLFALYRNATTLEEKQKIETKLIKFNIKMAHNAVHRQSTRLLPFSKEELFSFSQEGLWTAIKNYDPATGYQFSTFATIHVNGRILRAIRDQGSLIRIPQNVQAAKEADYQSLKFVSIDAEDCSVQLDYSYPQIEINESIEEMLRQVKNIQVNNNNWRQAFTDSFNTLIDAGLIEGRKDNSVSKVTNGIEKVQLSLI